MEQVPRLKNSVKPLPCVPYLADRRFEYEVRGPEGLKGFLEHKKFNATKFEDASHTLECSSIFQSWLFFGPLKEICHLYGIPFSIEDFVRHEDGVAYIVTDKLEWYLLAWVMHEKKDHGNCLPSETEVRVGFRSTFKESRHFRWCIEKDKLRSRAIQIQRLLSTMSNLMARYEKTDAILDEVFDSTLMLGVCLENTASRLFYCQRVSFRELVLFSEVQCRLTTEFFREGKWCIRERRTISAIFDNNPFALFAAAQLDRSTEPRAGQHAPCNETKCTAHQVDESNYRSRHSQLCSNHDCAFIGFDNLHEEDPFKNICEASVVPERIRSVPVVSYAKGTINYSNVSLLGGVGEDFVDYAGSMFARFVAVSHVWADGLGNPSANNLPECQLERMQRFANELFPSKYWPIPFWMDTMCLPLEKASRLRLIGRMNSIYRSATKILVLDEVLCHTPSDGLSSEELAIRIICCPWSQRLWTLQEAGMLHRAHFVFADAIVDFESSVKGWATQCLMSRTLSQIPTHHFLRQLLDGLLCSIKSRNSCLKSPNWDKYIELAISPFWARMKLHFDSQRWRRWSSTNRQVSIEELMRKIMFRNLSKKGDEGIVLAALLNQFSLLVPRQAALPTEISQTPREERYRKLFTSVRIFPQNVIFLNEKRYEDYGSRWIPRSLLTDNNPLLQPVHPGEMAFSTERPTIYNMVTKDGIAVELPVFEIDQCSFPLPSNFLVHFFDVLYVGFVHCPGSNAPYAEEFHEPLVIITEAKVKAGPRRLVGVLATPLVVARGGMRQIFNGAPTRFEALIQFTEADHSHGALPLIQVKFDAQSVGRSAIARRVG